MTDYADFIARKLAHPPATGFEPDHAEWPHLFPFQRDLVRWALRRGRAAIFAGTGLGKTRMQLTWAHEVAQRVGERVLILAPLAVAQQTVAEGAAVGVEVAHNDESGASQIVVTNYDRLHRFNPDDFGAVVLDESSCIKHYDTKTLATVLDAFGATPYKLCCTATPAPNDWVELGTHAEFLGACTRREMMSEFFAQNRSYTKEWVLKGHARGAFWAWVASWGALVSSPADLGYSADGFALPPLTTREHILETAEPAPGSLFVMAADSLMDRRRARKSSTGVRVEACAAVVACEPREPWIVWCDLNAESEALVTAIPGAVEIRGSMPAAEKEARLLAFSRGQTRVLVTKPSIAGFGLNWQHCARMAFVGVTDSWESYYQAVRRCWRFGQRRPVEVHVFVSDLEGSVLANLNRKDAAAKEMGVALARETSEAVQLAVRGLARSAEAYCPTTPMEVPAWLKTETE